MRRLLRAVFGRICKRHESRVRYRSDLCPLCNKVRCADMDRERVNTTTALMQRRIFGTETKINPAPINR